MSTKLSVVIPFLNEGEELKTTLSQIRETSGDNVDIIVVNDASTDGIDYRSIAAEFRATYIEHKARNGSGASKQEGIMHCKTPYFIAFDAHMRFYDKHWWRELIKCLELNPNAIYCLKCKPWNAETKTEMDIPAHGGACAELFSKEPLSFLNLKWLAAKNSNEEVYAIPCVLGACYASSLNYWKKVRGFEGLEGYGSEEIFVSLKAWMEGGGCYLVNKITVGHLFRKEFPYTIGKDENILNKMYIIDVLFPVEYKALIFSEIKHLQYLTYKEYLRRDNESVKDARLYYQSISNHLGFRKFMEINEKLSNKL